MSNINNKLWSMADSLRNKSSMEANEFKNYILGLMFFKFISDKNESFYKEALDGELTIKQAFENPEFSEYKSQLTDDARENLGYALDYKSLFSTLIKAIKCNEYTNEMLQNALQYFNNNIESSEDFANLFNDLNLSSNRLGKTEASKSDVISDLMIKLEFIESEIDEFNVDTLGDAYEYLISRFASNAGKKAGEFYTPQNISTLLAKLVTVDEREIKDIYDPTCGSGSLLLRVAKEITDNGQKYGSINGQEIIMTTYNLARMNMIIHGININDFHIEQGDTILDPSKKLNKKYDAIVSNPPYGMKWDSPQRLVTEDSRFYKYGAIAPKGAMEMSFVQHIESVLSDKGVSAILLPVGVLFWRGAENKILTKIIDDNYLDTVILLPSNMFYSTSIPVVCLVIKKCKTKNGVYLIDASDLCVKENKKNVLTNKDIGHIVDLYQTKKDTQISKLLDMDLIKQNGYNLNVTRYIQRNKEEELDIDALGANIKKHISELIELEKDISIDIKNIKELLK